LPRTDVLGHSIHQIKNKLGEKCTQYLAQIAVGGVLILHHFVHVLSEVGCLLRVEVDDGASEFCYRLIGGVNNVAHGRYLECRLFVDYHGP